ncbi:SufS family cysteine desulfurase [Thalassotalea crassostreae]|uniref:SufS family cysteine desulfurase n=1 Tax=Thalassotalea crassostreae TaxID=1763536 RepID=UPI000839AA80|nr:SufS family cysteine desulfurase [Thalassotalea crassostreae]
MKDFDISSLRKKFPILQTLVGGRELVYFDNAATTQKLNVMIDSSSKFYQQINANVHRSSHYLSSKATSKFERARQQVQQFINARNIKEIIWTKGSTDAINLVAQSFSSRFISAGDEIVISTAEHHANIVPWQQIAQAYKAKLVVLPLTQTGIIDVEQAKLLITNRCKIVAINHISNVIGKVNPIKQVISIAKKNGAKTLIDGAQAVAHVQIDVQALDCDFYIFSAHKMYGPTGVGVLYGKQELLEQMPPYQFGGEMIKKVSFAATTFNELPFKFEAGTPNIAGVVSFLAVLEWFNQTDMKPIWHWEQQLNLYLFQQLQSLQHVQFLVDDCSDIPLFSFTLKNSHHQDCATFLDSKGIAVRSGHHCAMPLLESLNLDGSIRVSATAYNTFEEIDYFIKQLTLFCQGESADNHANAASVNESTVSSVAESTFVTSEEILNKFAKAKSWDLKHREIMLLSKLLPRLSKEQRDDDDLISGCESKAWIQTQKNNDNLSFIADSDAKVIRGLMVIILSIYQGRTAEQILSFDIDSYFQQLGLMQHLSPSRGNGVMAIVNKIQQIATTEASLN